MQAASLPPPPPPAAVAPSETTAGAPLNLDRLARPRRLTSANHPVISFPVLGQFYPARARRAKVEGDVSATCAVTMGGALTQCAVNSESPAGYGFGEATLRALAQTQVQVVIRRGVQTPQVLHIPIAWRLPGSPASADPTTAPR